MNSSRLAFLTVALSFPLAPAPAGCSKDSRAARKAADVVCAAPLKDYCSSGDQSTPLCSGSLTEARVWCSDPPESSAFEKSLTPSACSGYFQVGYHDRDKDYTYYYDAHSGELAAVFAGAANRASTCVAGPRVFHPIDCPQLSADGVAAEPASASPPQLAQGS
jgi:hypothetical protein